MVRNFLGNIKGPQGSQGPQGDPGGFNGEAIDIINLLNFSEIEAYNDGEVNYDPVTGLINYSELAYYFRVYVPLKPKKYYFRASDYTSHSGLYAGRIRLRIEALDGDPVFNQEINKNTITEVDLTGDVERIYEVRFYMASSEPLSGYIEKPMLTEGEHPALWNTSDTDKNTLLKQNRVTGRFYLPEINNDGTFENLSVYNLTSSEFMSVQDVGILFEDGLYLMTNTTNLTENDGVVTLNVRVNGVSERIAEFPADTSGSFSHMFSLSKGDIVDVRISYTGNDKGTMPATARNGFTITKL